MNERFLDYFKAIGITEPIRKQLEALLKTAEALCLGDEFVDVAVSDYVNEDGTKSYGGARFYSGRRVVLVRDINKGDDFSVRGLKQEIVYIAIKATNYDFKKATDKSRINIVAHYTHFEEAFAAIYGSGANCDHLMEIYRKYYLPVVMS